MHDSPALPIAHRRRGPATPHPSRRTLCAAAFAVLALAGCSSTDTPAPAATTAGARAGAGTTAPAPSGTAGSTGPATTPVPGSVVFVTTRAIAYGSSGDQALRDGAIVTRPAPAGAARPATAIQEAGEIGAKVAIAEIPAGTTVLSGMFVDPCLAEPCGSIPRAEGR